MISEAPTVLDDGPFSADQVAGSMLVIRLQIVGYAQVIVRDMQLAEDVFQEVCVEAVKCCDKFHSDEHLFRWAMKTARYRATDQCRKRARQPCSLSPELLSQLADDWIVMVLRDDNKSYPEAALERLEECMDQLTPRARQLMLLRYREGRKSAEIAALLNQRIQAVYKATSRAILTLRTCMKKGRSLKA